MTRFEARLTRQVHPGLRLDLQFTLDAECGVLFGASGAGKTTALRMIAGLTRPDAGTVRLGGEVLFDSATKLDRPMRSRRIGLIFQDDLLFPHLTVANNVRFGLKGWPRAEAEARAGQIAGLCGITHLIDRRPETLSGGERQRVGLARALAPRPQLLLCDEPVSALDLDSRHALLERLREAQEAEAIPLLYVTHSPAEAIALGAKLFLLEGGRIVAEGAPLDVLAARNDGQGSHLEGLRNVLPCVVEAHAPDGGETTVRLAGGPSLIVPYNGRPAGSALVIAVRADDVLLARGPVGGLSARNVLAGTVERVVAHGAEAEVVVRTGEARWIVSVVAPAVASLALAEGSEVHLILKARACRILE